MSYRYVAFFFQAEDGIRDVAVTGVQTCALPIFPEYRRESRDGSRSGHRNSSMGSRNGTGRDADFPIRPGTVCKGLKTQASQIPKRCGTSWEAVGIVFSTILAIVPAVPARPCMRGGTGTGTWR